MYLIITEDCTVLHTEEVSEELLEECDAGILEVICMKDPKKPQYYYEGWYDVGKYEE